MQDALAENMINRPDCRLESKNALFQADLELARQLQETLPRDYPIFRDPASPGQVCLFAVLPLEGGAVI
jgi:hypothetical protein